MFDGWCPHVFGLVCASLLPHYSLTLQKNPFPWQNCNVVLDIPLCCLSRSQGLNKDNVWRYYSSWSDRSKAYHQESFCFWIRIWNFICYHKNHMRRASATITEHLGPFAVQSADLLKKKKKSQRISYPT